MIARVARGRKRRAKQSDQFVDRQNGDRDGVYVFDAAAADHACWFIQTFLVHSKGEWYGRPFILERWQRWIIREIFGWKRPDGTRRYRTVYIEIPRKNGKSTFAAAIALLLLIADDENGAEVYCAAADKEQAKIVFDEAKKMVNASAELSDVCSVFASSIFDAQTLSKYQVLSSDANTKHGLSPHGAIFDELHAWPNRDLFDVLTTAQGARRQPLTIMITTAGFDRHSICWEQHDYALKVRDGIVEDPTFLPIIFAADENDDWHSEATWAKANPNLGVSISWDFLREEHRKACESPARENAFKQLYLNIWTEQATRWLAIDVWDRAGKPVSLEDLRGRECWCGLDLSNTTDLAAFVAVFPDPDGVHFDVVCRFWCPEEGAAKRARNDRVPYPTWISKGLITATPGNVIDYDQIRADIGDFAKVYQVREIAYDPWNAIQLVTKLAGDDGLPMVEHRQGYATMSDPTKRLEVEVLQASLRHGGHPVLRWMASNVVVERDPAGNLKPSKKRSQERIDGIVALIMGLGRAVHQEGKSVYENRGLIVI